MSVREKKKKKKKNQACYRVSVIDMLLLQSSFFFTTILLFIIYVKATDPDPLTDFNQNLTTFVLRDIFSNGDVSIGPGGTRAALNISIFPALASQGITMVRFQMVPCGVNPPHIHPRATEMLALIQGGPLQVGFVDTHGVPHIEILNAGDITIFPRGLLHFELNVGTETAHYVSALNSQNPGTLTAVEALFHIPERALASALNQKVADILGIKATLYGPTEPKLEKSETSGCIPGKHVVTNF